MECTGRNPDSRHISLSLETQTSGSEQVVAKKHKLDDGESTKASLKKTVTIAGCAGTANPPTEVH